MNKCYFCGLEAPEIELNEKMVLNVGNIEGIRGVYRVRCSCGKEIMHDNEESLKQLWNYESAV